MAGRSRRFVRGPRKATDWSASAPSTGFISVAASTAQLLQTFVPIAGGETVVRVRGILSIKSDQIASAENQIGAYGIGVVSAQAEALGITAIPHPSTDSSWGGWLFHQYFANALELATAVGFVTNKCVVTTIDSKAMRKVGDEERLVFVIENSAAFGIQVLDPLRVLSKLH